MENGEDAPLTDDTGAVSTKNGENAPMTVGTDTGDATGEATTGPDKGEATSTGMGASKSSKIKTNPANTRTVRFELDNGEEEKTEAAETQTPAPPSFSARLVTYIRNTPDNIKLATAYIINLAGDIVTTPLPFRARLKIYGTIIAAFGLWLGYYCFEIWCMSQMATVLGLVGQWAGLLFQTRGVCLVGFFVGGFLVARAMAE